LVHPGGPFWRNKDEHGWSIPKGELDHNERPSDPGAEIGEEVYVAAARREFTEETGNAAPEAELVALPELRLSSAKRLRAFAAAGDLDPETITSNTFELEWPPRSGTTQSFPEVDRAAWFTFDEARIKLHKGQVGLVDLLEDIAISVLG
jgi:predicted NUDIX family NTP pyrophosphohydrolase